MENIELVSGTEVPSGLEYFTPEEFFRRTGINSTDVIEEVFALPDSERDIRAGTWSMGSTPKANFPFPPSISELATALADLKIFPHIPNNAFANKYDPSDLREPYGLVFHSDAKVYRMSDVVCALTLGAERVMRFRNVAGNRCKLLLADESLYKMTGNVLAWEHGYYVKWDTPNGTKNYDATESFKGRSFPPVPVLSITFRDTDDKPVDHRYKSNDE